MKQDLFAMKAVQAKGYDIQELIKLDDSKLDELPLPNKLIQAVKEYKGRGGKTAQQIAEEIADIMIQDEPVVEPTTSVDETIESYKTNTEEQQKDIEEIQSSVVIPEDEVEIVRTESAQEDVDAIAVALQEKEFKSFAPYMKHLKSAVPAQILTAVDSTKVNELIDIRIAEVKAKDESTK